MAKIQNKDIEDLHKIKNDILEIKKKIEELEEIKELKKLQHEATILENKIVKYSTYDSVQIANILATLMTFFEETEYGITKNNILFSNYDYCIKPKSNNIAMLDIYPEYQIKNRKQEKLFLDPNENKERCYLPLSSLNKNSSSPNHLPNKDIEYIQQFIDYLYERRTNKALEEIPKQELEDILQEFLTISVELKQQRKKEREQKQKKKMQDQKRKEFEKSCLIDRKLILNSLAYLINHYEEHMSAKLEKEKKLLRSSQWSEFIGYHKLIINWNDKEICFEAKIDSQGCYPDEEYCGVSIDMNKRTDICFFELKNTLSIILKNSDYILEFMKHIEEMYLEKQKITYEDINHLLINIANDKKAKQKILKL